MQELIDQVRATLRTTHAEMLLISTGHADRVAGGCEGAAKRAAVGLKTAEAKLVKAQDMGKAAATEIVKDLDATRDRIAQRCRQTARVTGFEGTPLAGYPADLEKGPVHVNGRPMIASVFTGIFQTDLARQLADAAGVPTDAPKKACEREPALGGEHC